MFTRVYNFAMFVSIRNISKNNDMQLHWENGAQTKSGETFRLVFLLHADV